MGAGAGQVFATPANVPEGFVHDARSGWYYHAATGYYFDASTSLYYSPATQKYYRSTPAAAPQPHTRPPPCAASRASLGRPPPPHPTHPFSVAGRTQV